MPQSFLNKRLLYALATAGLLSRVAQIQMFSQNKFPITPEQYIILSMLVENGELYQRQICEITRKDRPNITRLINILEKEEYVKRISDVNKRKIYKIRLTEKGKNIFTEIRPYLVNLRDEAVRGIKKEDLEKCNEILGKMIDNLETKVKIQM
ncbi:TPA: MarR family transcriptional regulator [Candidatus Galligastranaerophilus gallistercoris]|nr:MarR family transcriptional regulator [Candidatus Galligastranaerophilus gallistercoris]